jgi:hypothetical protein
MAGFHAGMIDNTRTHSLSIAGETPDLISKQHALPFSFIVKAIFVASVSLAIAPSKEEGTINSFMIKCSNAPEPPGNLAGV